MASDDKASKPAGEGGYVVGKGDSMTSIADAHGFFWETLWSLPANAELKEARGNPEVLLVGDKVTIPNKRQKTHGCATGSVHRFRRHGVPVKIGFRVAARSGQVFANKKYVLEVGDRRYEGTTDGEGSLEHWVAPVAHVGVLTVWLDEPSFPATAKWTLAVGQLPPLDTVAGVQARLANLGYRCRPSGTLDDATKAALEAFQRKHTLEQTGQRDDATVSKLEQICTL